MKLPTESSDKIIPFEANLTIGHDFDAAKYDAGVPPEECLVDHVVKLIGLYRPSYLATEYGLKVYNSLLPLSSQQEVVRGEIGIMHAVERDLANMGPSHPGFNEYIDLMLTRYTLNPELQQNFRRLLCMVFPQLDAILRNTGIELEFLQCYTLISEFPSMDNTSSVKAQTKEAPIDQLINDAIALKPSAAQNIGQSQHPKAIPLKVLPGNYVSPVPNVSIEEAEELLSAPTDLTSITQSMVEMGQAIRTGTLNDDFLPPIGAESKVFATEEGAKGFAEGLMLMNYGIVIQKDCIVYYAQGHVREAIDLSEDAEAIALDKQATIEAAKAELARQQKDAGRAAFFAHLNEPVLKPRFP
jgi:hypothetical protein